MEYIALGHNQTIMAHSSDKCLRQNCCLHNPSDHHMKDWPLYWRNDAAKMERICSHGIGHPDPDDLVFLHSIGRDESIHGCDGCCVRVGE